MAAPKGNQFWKLRSKHGISTIFENAKVMQEEGDKYFQWCIDNPLIKYEAKLMNTKKGQVIVNHPVPVMRAFSIHGLCLFLGVNTLYFRDFKKRIEGKEDERSKDFAQVIAYFEEVIYNQQWGGAASGLLKENIISRTLGLADKNQHEGTINTKNQTTIDVSKLPTEVLQAIITQQNEDKG